MNSLLNLWQLLGWTMVFFLVTGTLILFVAAALRVSLKRASPNVRYATSLATFAVLALAPVVIAGYLIPSPIQPEIANDSVSREAERVADERSEVSREAERVADERSGQPQASATQIPGWNNRAILAATVNFLPWLWLVGTPLTFLLIATGWIGTERLRKSCKTLTDGPIHATCEELRGALKLSRKVGVAICHSISSPLLIGVVKPLILLPPAALTGWTTDELEMVLTHELAHVRRWDNAVNLAQRIVESVLFFHPATWIMSNWVRRDREDCCDAVVIGQTAKPQVYAELLLTLASHTPGLATSVAMAQHPVAARIRRILKIDDEPMLVSHKGFFVGIGAGVVAALLAFALPTSDAEDSFSREAERSADERVEDERVADERDSTSPFPTLEEQRAADLAYKLLGVELEKLTPEDLERAKAKGYRGGLKVASVGVGGLGGGPIGSGDLLVGLHVWPTESLSQVTEILQRDDLDQLALLKFYVLRAMPHQSQEEFGRGSYGGEMGEAEVKMVDGVVTGRIQVDLGAWRAMQTKDTPVQFDPGPVPSAGPRFAPINEKQSSLLYDGKTFDEWRTLWTTELKTEKRIECIKALAAFGRTGRGKEAAEAILDVAEQYDFGKGESNSATDLKSAISVVLTGSEGIDGKHWLPLLVERLKSNPQKWGSFAGWVLSDVQGENIAPLLKEIATNEELAGTVRGHALAGLVMQPNIAEDQEAVALVHEGLQSNDPAVVERILGNLRFNRLDLFPEQIDLLLSKDNPVTRYARMLVQNNTSPTLGTTLFNTLMKIVNDQARQDEHWNAIESFNLLLPFYNYPEVQDRKKTAIAELGHSLLHGDKEQLPTALAAMSILTNRSPSEIIEKPGKEILSEERRAELRDALDKLKEFESQNNGRSGKEMDGGGMGGGGMF